MGLFSRSKPKGSPQVGPILSSFYEQMDPGYRADFVRFISGAPSGGELLVTFRDAPVETVTDILLAFEQEGLPGHGVIGAQESGSGGLAIYIKGDFDQGALDELAQAFREAGRRFALDADVASGRFEAGQLRELR